MEYTREDVSIVKCDNLYIDLNGSIHTAMQSATDERDLFEKLFARLDDLVATCPPRRLLYIAVP